MALLGGSCKKEGKGDERTEARDEQAHPRPAGDLKLSHVKLIGPAGDQRRRFSRGETVMCRFAVRGFEAPGGKLHLVSDLFLERPDGTTVMHKGPDVVVNQEIPKGRSRRAVRAAVKLELSRAAAAGSHRLRVRLTEVSTKRSGELEAAFEVRGRSYGRTDKLSFNSLKMPPAEDLRPGGAVRAHINVSGFSFKDLKPNAGSGRPRWKVVLEAKMSLREASDGPDEKKQAVHTETEMLANTVLPFRPTFLPLEASFTLPEGIDEGDYRFHIQVCDKVAERCISARPKVRVMPAGFGAYALVVQGAGGVRKKRYYRGERLVVSFEVWGYEKPANVVGDIALQGPRGGVYLLKKKAFSFKGEPNRGVGPSRRYAIPMTIPEFVPRGEFTVHIRLRDLAGKQEASRKITFEVEGKKIPPLPSLQITELELRAADRRRKRITAKLYQGQDIEVSAVCGGMKLRPRPGHTYAVDLRLNLYLREPDGELIVERKNVAQLSRNLAFPPLRLRLAGSWRVPGDVKGLKLLQVEVVNRVTDRVSMRQRRVMILPR